MRGYRRLLRYLRPEWRALVGVIGTTVLASAVAVLEPWPLKVLIDNVVGNKPRPGWLETVLSALPGSDGQRDLLFWIVVASVLIFVVELAFIAVNAVLTATLSQRMTYRL